MSFASTLMPSTLVFPSMFAVPLDSPTPTPTVDERVAEVIKHAEHLLAAGELFVKTNPPCGHGPRQPTPYDAWINDVLETSALAIVAHFDAEPRLRLRVAFCDEVLGYFYNVAHKARRRQQELQRKASRDPRKRLPMHNNNNTTTPTTTTDGGVARTTRRAPPAAAHPYQRPVRASRQPEVLPAPAPVVEPSAIDDLCALLGSASLGTSTSAEDPAPAPAPRPENSSREHEAYLPMHAGPGPMRSRPSRAASNPLDRAGRKTRLAL